MASLQAGCALTSPASDSVVKEAAYGALPLLFIPNHGQFDSRVAYAVQGSDTSIFFSDQGVTFVLSEQPPASGRKARNLLQVGPLDPEAQVPRQRWALKVDFVDANPNARPESLEQAETLISYFKGQPDEWRAGLQACRRIIYRDLWPGIDLVYSGTVNRLKYDFIVHPGADPDRIRLAWRGADSVHITPEGQLAITTPLGTLRDEIPVAWQEEKGLRESVAVAYGLQGPAGVQVASLATDGLLAGENLHERVQIVGFTVGDYDRTRTLVLDPDMLVYCGFIGGSLSDEGRSIAVDNNGNAYVTGFTYSTETSFPVVVGPDASYNGGGDYSYDVFVAKIKADGTGLIYCGFIGGTGYDYGYGIAVDDEGNAYVTGYVGSAQSSFPAVVGPDLSPNGSSDAFVAKVMADGTGLAYCGFIGGVEFELGFGIAVDSNGSAYISGWTSSAETSFPATAGPDSSYNGGPTDAFVAKVKADGTGLEYSGFIGGTGADYGYGIAVDNGGNAYVTGATNSTESSFPIAAGPDLSHNGGGNDAFVAKVRADGTGLAYSGFIGGAGDEFGFGIAVDNYGKAYVTGKTSSTEASFPVIAGPDLSQNGFEDAFVAKVKADGTGLEYCGFIGGSDDDRGLGVAVDSRGNAYVTGGIRSTDTSFPVTAGLDQSHHGNSDAFIAKIKPDGTELVYGGFFGGEAYDDGFGVAVDNYGNAYVTGTTYSTEASFTAKVGPDLTYNDSGDAFVVKINSMEDDFPWPIFLPAIMEGRKNK